MSKKVLIVDDAAVVRRSIRELVEDNGFEVIGEAENGAVGISQYKKLKPDIVTMDIMMEGVDGIKAVKGIMKYDSKAKIVMVTAAAQENMVRQAVKSGAKSFIAKPFNRTDLINALEKVLMA